MGNDIHSHLGPLRWHHVCREFVLYQEYRGWGREGGGEGEGIMYMYTCSL